MASNKKSKVDLVEIDAARINDVCDNYFKWKSLNDSLKSFCSRGINMPDSISEPIGCFCLDYFWNKGSGGDAITRDGRKVEFKALSVVTKRISVKISHDLNVLYADVLEGFNNLSINNNDVF